MATAIICDYCDERIGDTESRYIVTAGHYEMVETDPDPESPAPPPYPPSHELPIGGHEMAGLSPTDSKRTAYHDQCWAKLEPHLTEKQINPLDD